MIHRLTIRNFKSIREQTYDFSEFDLLVGPNDSGKSTVLQALAVWQFCVEEFRREWSIETQGPRHVALADFTALPVPEFLSLWTEHATREGPEAKEKDIRASIPIEIEVTWRNAQLEDRVFAVKLRYVKPQLLQARPGGGWARFRALDQEGPFPMIAYVPSFSGLEPAEEWRDDGPLRRQIGRAQPGSVLRNLLLRVCPPAPRDEQGHPGQSDTHGPGWWDVTNVVRKWFSAALSAPRYERGVSSQIVCNYVWDHRYYDLLAGGSGFHQVLTLFALLHGSKATTFLLDQPDAHLHPSLQRNLLDYLLRRASEAGTQYIVATNSQEFITGVEPTRMVFLRGRKAVRAPSAPARIAARLGLSNTELASLMASPVMLYVQGESDQRILRAWAGACGATDIFGQVCFRVMRSGDTKTMRAEASRHFAGVTRLVPKTRCVMLFDFDAADTALQPGPENMDLHMWKRKGIENYLLVPEAWERAGIHRLGGNPLAAPLREAIHAFFAGENLTLPEGQSWRTVSASIFEVVRGKLLLFEDENSLFQQLFRLSPSVELTGEAVALAMTADEIHDDVYELFAAIRTIIKIKRD